MIRKTVTLDNMNPRIKKMEYPVGGGPLVIRAGEIERELEKGTKKPFEKVIRADVGGCHAMGQKPLTFTRQVLTLCTYPRLLKDDMFPDDVKRKAVDILEACSGGSIGSYHNSTGLDIIKQHIAQYIQRRDKIPSNYKDVIVCSGASDGIKNVLNLLNYACDGKLSGIMVPIPQYPLYPAIIAELGMHQIRYYLDEDNAWEINIKELKRAIEESRTICEPRALVVINPGNPTGSLLTRENIVEVIKFAYNERLFLMADEVYQDNIYGEGIKFYSFKKVMSEMGDPYKNMELTSFMSASNGYMGECGLRGGYCEMLNVEPEIQDMYKKCASTRACSNAFGQVAMDCAVNPPQKGDPSYDTFIKEKMAVLQPLKEKALLVEKAFNKIEGINCNQITGAVYAFPRLTIPQKAIAKARSLGQEADFFYAMQLLENTGICVEPGNSFGQKSGTYHFRTTILLETDILKIMLKKLEEFHKKFLEEYQ